jgi:hypothetical protein
MITSFPFFSQNARSVSSKPGVMTAASAATGGWSPLTGEGVLGVDMGMMNFGKPSPKHITPGP